jgi:lanosterol synthase
MSSIPLDPSMVRPEIPALERGADHLVSMRQSCGCWEAEVVWCPLILAQCVIVRTIVGRPFEESERLRIAQHLRVTRTPEGGWGMHGESPPYVFVTTLAYIALRLIGLGPDDPLVRPAREWLRAQPGGVLAIPSWGKFWLAMLGLYDYAAVNPVQPELFLLPGWLPVHPFRYYCHTRYIYLGIAFLFGSRFRADLGSVIADLRSELFSERFESIDFKSHRHDLAPTDLYVRPSAGVRLAYDALHAYERFHSARVRRRALDFCFERILYEQRTSRYQAISPVNGLLNCLAIYSRDPRHPDLAPSMEGLEYWRWDDAQEGIRYTGARSITWDTAFAMQALLENPAVAARAAEPLKGAYKHLRETQITAELPRFREERRDPAVGGWCFNEGHHRWPVSDCAAEALCAVLKLHRIPGLLPAAERISDDRLRQAVEFILYRQNPDGGFGSYERRRGSSWLERMNPSEMFGNCMTERSYVECTGSALRALALFREQYPQVLRSRVDQAMVSAIRFLRGRQQPDGSYLGFWGINFTYAIFFVVDALLAAGVSHEDPALRRASEWLVSKQRADGGWGEHYTSCLKNSYVEHAQSQTEMTSWALLSLVETLGPDSETVARGIAWLRSRQSPDGSWPKGAVNGVFFQTAMHDYRLYRIYFPVWALARHSRLKGFEPARSS